MEYVNGKRDTLQCKNSLLSAAFCNQRDSVSDGISALV